MIKQLFLIFCFFLISSPGFSQPIAESKNGKLLPVKGHLRILLIFAEVNYDVHPEKDPYPQETTFWKRKELPNWSEEMFDPFPDTSNLKGTLTKYYRENSFGSFLVTGDHIEKIITLNESEINNLYWNNAINSVLEKINKAGKINTTKNLAVEDFDNWTMTSPGQPKITPSTDLPHKYDHVMFIFRNLANFGDYSGLASPGSPGKLLGFESDSYSIFRASSDLPINISRHEFGHLLMGDNNFHSSGGQHRMGGANYFIPSMCGWGLIGGGNSSLLTCNAWDRDRMDWRGAGKSRTISAISQSGEEINTDLDASTKIGEGEYILRDYMTTGDAMRIRLPYLTHGEFQQYIWIENHQTIKNNKSSFDKFRYQGDICVDDATPGLYMYMQVDKDQKSGADLYGGFADFLRPITAEGFFDYTFTDTLKNDCLNSNKHLLFEKQMHKQNPFTGNQDQEFPVGDFNNDGFISSSESLILGIEKVGIDTIKNVPYLGDKRDAFTLKGNNKIGIGTNPSTAPMMTLVSDNESKGGVFGSNGEGLPNNRKIILNGLSIEIIDEMSNGAIKVLVKFNDVEVAENVRWCADTILLPTKKSGVEYSLNVLPDVTIRLDQGLTPTRIINPLLFNGAPLFCNPTHFICADSAVLNMQEGAKLLIENGSVFHMMANSKATLKSDAEIIVEKGSTLIVENGANLLIKKGARLLVRKGGFIDFDEGSIIIEKGGFFKIRK